MGLGLLGHASSPAGGRPLERGRVARSSDHQEAAPSRRGLPRASVARSRSGQIAGALSVMPRWSIDKIDADLRRAHHATADARRYKRTRGAARVCDFDRPPGRHMLSPVAPLYPSLTSYFAYFFFHLACVGEALPVDTLHHKHHAVVLLIPSTAPPHLAGPRRRRRRCALCVQRSEAPLIVAHGSDRIARRRR
jgi:hypothetical protein